MKIKIAIIGVAISILLLSAPGCKLLKAYDPEGTWFLERSYGAVNDSITFIFTGSRDGGAVVWNEFVIGNYVFNYNDDVRFGAIFPEGILAEKTVTESYKGGFIDKDILSGTLTWKRDGVTLMGAWRAVRMVETF